MRSIQCFWMFARNKYKGVFGRPNVQIVATPGQLLSVWIGGQKLDNSQQGSRCNSYGTDGLWATYGSKKFWATKNEQIPLWGMPTFHGLVGGFDSQPYCNTLHGACYRYLVPAKVLVVKLHPPAREGLTFKTSARAAGTFALNYIPTSCWCLCRDQKLVDQECAFSGQAWAWQAWHCWGSIVGKSCHKKHVEALGVLGGLPMPPYNSIICNAP